MRRITPVLAVLLAAFLVSACVAGRVMTKYALAPKVHGVDDFERTRHKADSLMPGSTAWYDSLKAQGVLKDTFVVGYNSKRVHAVYAPAAQPDKAQGTAIIVHGYGDSHIVFIYLAKMYRDRLNYNILMPDLQYHGFSEGDSIQMGWLDRFDILNWINVAYGIFPNDFMLLHGVSMGAATVMFTSGEPTPDYVRCFIEDCGFNSVQGQFSKNIRDVTSLLPLDVLRSASIVTNRKYGWHFREADCSQALARCTKPMLFIHGDADDFVAFSDLQKNYDAKKQGYKDMWAAPGAVHANSYVKYPEEYTRRVANFLKTVHNMIEDGSIYD